MWADFNALSLAIGIFIGAAMGVFALGVVTRRCTCYPEDDK